MSTTTGRRRARLTLAYDGSGFHGFAANPGVRTVATTLREALEQVLQVEVALVAAGRTDAGVHARGQVVSVDLPAGTDLPVLLRQVNALCGPEIAARDAAWAPPDFHARFSAIWRHYRYRVLNSRTPDPFLASTAWLVTAPLHLRAMQLACDPIMGERDFSAFCRRPKPDPEADEAREASLRRHVMVAAWRDEGDGLLCFEVRANAFCHQMVRALVGTLVDVGAGKRPPSDMMALVASGDRAEASTLAPPHGLCLWEVGYPANALDPA